VQGFPGAIDEVAIYSRSLSAEEIKLIMDQGISFPVEPADKLAATWGFIKAGI